MWSTDHCVHSLEAPRVTPNRPPPPLPHDQQAPDGRGVYLTQSVFKVVLQKSTPPQTCQLILYHYVHKEQGNSFVSGLTFAKRLPKNIV